MIHCVHLELVQKTVKLLTQKTERSTNGRRRVKSSTPSASRTLSRSSRKRTATPSGNGVVDTKRLLLKREPCTEEKPSANVLTFAATPPSRRGQAWLDEDSDADSGVAMSRKAQDTPTSTRSASYTTKRTDQQPRERPDTDEEASMPTTTASDISETSEGVTSIECLVTEPGATCHIILAHLNNFRIHLERGSAERVRARSHRFVEGRKLCAVPQSTRG